MTDDEMRGYQKAVALLRDAERFWEFMGSHPLGEDGAEFAVRANDCAADYLDCMATLDGLPDFPGLDEK